MHIKAKRKIAGIIRSQKSLVKIIITLSIIVLFIILLSPVLKFARNNKLTPGFFANIVLSDNLELKETDNKTNILLLGIPGVNHDGIDLTDTMIFVSINTNDNRVVLVSLPRDIWIDSLKDKINTAYHYGESKKQGGGFILTKSAVSEVLGQPIHYVVMVDFDGFRKLIDFVGGIDVNVEESFIDTKFPIPGKENDECGTDKEYLCRYETISFTQGIHHMDGETALKFVRSRNAEGHQGTDFARSERQKKVLFAIKDKLIHVENLNPQSIRELTQLFDTTIKTDLVFSEGAYLGKYAFSFNGEVKSLHLDTGDDNIDGLLVNPPVEKYNKWVLIPRVEGYNEIHEYVSCHINSLSCPQYDKLKK